jgi:hypothetical protein
VTTKHAAAVRLLPRRSTPSLLFLSDDWPRPWFGFAYGILGGNYHLGMSDIGGFPSILCFISLGKANVLNLTNLVPIRSTFSKVHLFHLGKGSPSLDRLSSKHALWLAEPSSDSCICNKRPVPPTHGLFFVQPSNESWFTRSDE